MDTRGSRVENLSKAIASGLFFVAIGRLADVGFFYLLFVKFNVESVGTFNFAMAIAAFFGALVDFGFNQVFTREFSAGTLTFKRAFTFAVSIRLPIIFLSSLIYVAWINFQNLKSELYSVVGIALLIQLMIVSENTVQSWLRGNKRQTVANSLSVLDPVARLSVLMFLSFVGLEFSLTQMLVVVLILHVLIVCAHLQSAYRFGALSNFEKKSDTLTNSSLISSGAGFLCISIISIMQNRADWIILSLSVGVEELAHYSLANKLYEIVIMILGVIATALFPFMSSRNYGKYVNFKIGYFKKIIIFTGLTASCCMALLGPELIGFFLGNRYIESTDLIRVLVPLAGVSCVALVRYYEIASCGHERKLLKYSVIATLLQLVVNSLLIPTNGPYGAVFGMVVMVVLTTFMYTRFSLRKNFIKKNEVSREIFFIVLILACYILLIMVEISALFATLLIALTGVTGAYFVLLSRRHKRFTVVGISRVLR